jgi:hypothetical protein
LHSPLHDQIEIGLVSVAASVYAMRKALIQQAAKPRSGDKIMLEFLRTTTGHSVSFERNLLGSNVTKVKLICIG